MGEELKSLTLADLHALAKQKGLKGVSKLNKEELIDIIMKNSTNTNVSSLKPEQNFTSITKDENVSKEINHIIDEYYDEYSGVFAKSKKMLKDLDS